MQVVPLIDRDEGAETLIVIITSLQMLQMVKMMKIGAVAREVGSNS